MNLRTLAKAVQEAKRFLDAAEMVRAENNGTDPPEAIIVAVSKYSSACRRASMELSRALSELRKPS